MELSNKTGKLLRIILPAAFLFALFSFTPAQAAPGEGELTFRLTLNHALSSYFFTDIDVGKTEDGYSAVNMSYPAELQMNYNGAALSPTNRPNNWTVVISSGAGGMTNVSIMINAPLENGMESDIENFLGSCVFTLKDAGIYPPLDSEVTIMISEQVVVKYLDINGVTHVYEFVEFSQQPDRRTLTWLEAYNAARGRSFDGKRGYLATLTSIDEQMFIYNTIAQQPGWLGGTTLRYNSPGNPMIDGTTNISTNISDYTYNRSIANSWYWTDGPEAGTVFYNRPVRDDHNGPVPDVFNFFSNGWTYNTYPQYRNYIQNGNEPNGDGGECCLQFAWANKASWNDLTNNSSIVRGYYVEYDFPRGLSASGSATAVLTVPLTVSFDVGNNSCSSIIEGQTVWKGGTITEPSALTAGSLYASFGNRKFLGWFENPSDITPFDFSTPLTASNTQNNAKRLYGKWEQYHTVSFANTRGYSAPAQAIATGGTATAPQTSAWGDHTFMFYGWAEDMTADYGTFTPFDFSTPISADRIIYGMWDPIIYTLSFEPDGGSWDEDIAPRMREYCPGADNPPWDDFEPSHVPAAPSRHGYSFVGWMDENDTAPPDTAAIITASNVYFAVWAAETYSINYELTGGTLAAGNPDAYTAAGDLFPIDIGNPRRDGYIFLGWSVKYGNTSLQDISSPVLGFSILQGVTGDIYLTAHWQKIPEGAGVPPTPAPVPTTAPPTASPAEPSPTASPIATPHLPGGTDPNKPPIPNPGGILRPGGDGKYIEIGEDGTIRGQWQWDENKGMWVFTKYEYPQAEPAGDLPKTGDAGTAGRMIFLLCFSALGAAATLLCKKLTKRRGQ